MTRALRLVYDAGAADRRTRPGWRLLDRAAVHDLHGPVWNPPDLAPESLADHLGRVGRRPVTAGPAARHLVLDLAAVGLTGHGGGHFPVAVKWQAVLNAGGGGTVVANGAEGEPASAKDATLLQHRPHLVLDGLVCAAEAAGAGDLVVWLHEGARRSIEVLRRALAERAAAGFREPRVRVVAGPDRYLAGESSAIVRALSGGPALPAFTRVPAAVRGVGGLPTLVQNVETLARVALLARSGSSGYRPAALVTVVLGGRRIVLEAEPDWTVTDTLVAAGWASADPPQAVLVGGYGGTWLPWSSAAALPVLAVPAGTRLAAPPARAPLAPATAGVSLGAGVLVPLPRQACGLRETAAIVEYLAASGARQCGPCLFGLDAIAEILGQLAAGTARSAALRRLRRFTGEVSGRGACHHPDGAVRLVTTAMSAFATDVDAHRRGRVCPHAGRPSGLPLPGGTFG